MEHARSGATTLRSWARVCKPEFPPHLLPAAALAQPERYPMFDGAPLDLCSFDTLMVAHAVDFIAAVCRKQATQTFPALAEGHYDGGGHYYPHFLDDPRIRYVAQKDPRYSEESGKPISLVQTEDVLTVHYKDISLPPSKTGVQMGRIIADQLDQINREKGEARVFEMGVGSGVVPASIFRHVSELGTYYIGGDIDESCLWITDTSLCLNGVSRDDYRLKCGSILEPLHGERVDLIFSNPPYFPTAFAQDKPHVGPKSALDGGRDGLDFYRALFEDGPKHLTQGGKILVQVSNVNLQLVRALATARFGSRARTSVFRENGRHIYQSTPRGRAVMVELI